MGAWRLLRRIPNDVARQDRGGHMPLAEVVERRGASMVDEETLRQLALRLGCAPEPGEIDAGGWRLLCALHARLSVEVRRHEPVEALDQILGVRDASGERVARVGEEDLGAAEVVSADGRDGVVGGVLPRPSASPNLPRRSTATRQLGLLLRR